ncbi:MAG TPA: insulinase family protein [Opitutaceae bacterium]|nr:insulinase family protein [Opitutaceae bacterium]
MIISFLRIRTLLAAALVAAGAAGSLISAEAPRFAHEASDLKPEAGVTFGKLPNGMRYVVMANKEPKSRASLRLLVNAGSLHENEDQRGLAHFLEHMAFNGSTHYEPGTLVEFFQRMGMSFGGDTNASTSFDRTLYLLELADTKTETLAEGFQVFADYAGGLLLLPRELDKERGIILSEKRARDSIDFRTFVAQFEFALGTTRLPQRIPIGLAEVIEKAPRERFVEFYDTWYRPELMSVVAVGDFDAGAVEKQIVSAFSHIKARAPAKPLPDFGKVAPTPGLHVHFHPESESPNTSLSISTYTAITAKPDTAANRLALLPRTMAHAIINRRFSNLAKKENAAFISARISASEQFDLFREVSLDLTAKADQWAAALAVGEQELRRALQFGFQAGELAEVRANFLNGLEQAVKTAATRRSPNLADDLTQDLLSDNVSTDPQADLALYKPALEAITPEICLAALRETWAADHRYVMVSGNASIPTGTEAITAAFEASRAVAVVAPAAENVVSWAYTNFGPAGTVKSRDVVADLDITRVVFANGVRLNLKKTAFEANRILLNARVGSGSITEPKDKRGLASVAGGTFDAGGLGRHSTDDLMRIFAGKTLSIGFRPAPDAFEFVGGTNSRDLLLALQFLTAKLTDPGYRPEALRQAHKGIEQMFLGFAHTPNGPMATEVANLLGGGDHRFGTPPKEVLLSRTLNEVRDWLAPELTKGAIEIGLVGDLDVEACIDAVARTLGALPERSEKPALSELRRVQFPVEPFFKEYTISTQIPKGLAVFYWPTTDGFDARMTRRLNLLASIFADRLRVKIREEMAGTYSPSARSNSSDVYPNYGYIMSAIDIDPSMKEQIEAAIKAISADLFEKGVSEDELTRAKQPILTSVRESVRTNGYWLGSVVARAQEKPIVLDWARTRESDITGISKAEIDDLAKRYLSPERGSRVFVLPAAKATP